MLRKHERIAASEITQPLPLPMFGKRPFGPRRHRESKRLKRLQPSFRRHSGSASKAVDNLPLVNRTLVAASLGRRDLRSDQGPLLVRHITRIPQLATVIPAAVLVRPHWQSLRIGTAVRESQATQ